MHSPQELFPEMISSKMVGRRLASMVFPEPGGPIMTICRTPLNAQSFVIAISYLQNLENCGIFNISVLEFS